MQLNSLPGPKASLDFMRFSSDQVKGFNRIQVEIIRKYSPGKTILHNFMGGFLADFQIPQELPPGPVKELIPITIEWVALLDAIVEQLARAENLNVAALPDGVSSRARGRLRFYFNYGPEPVTLHLPPETKFGLGGPELPVAGLAAIEQEE